MNLKYIFVLAALINALTISTSGRAQTTVFSAGFESGSVSADVGTLSFSGPGAQSIVAVTGNHGDTDWGNSALFADRSASSGMASGFTMTWDLTDPVALNGATVNLDYVLRRSNTNNVKSHFVNGLDSNGSMLFSLFLVDREDGGLTNAVPDYGPSDERQRQTVGFIDPVNGQSLFPRSSIAAGTVPDTNDGANNFDFLFGRTGTDGPVDEGEAGVFSVSVSDTGWTLNAKGFEGSALADFTTTKQPFFDAGVLDLAKVEVVGETVQAGGFWDNLSVTGNVVQPLSLQVLSTGQIKILGGNLQDGSSGIEIDYISIESADVEMDGGSLDPDGFTGIGGDPNFPAGNGNGTGWEMGDNNTDKLLIESHLPSGGSTIGNSDEVDLGLGFVPGSTQDITFTYHQVGKLSGSVGDVEYVTVSSLVGDFNGDNVVSLTDYTVWRDNLGAPDSVLPPGSTDDASGFVDAGDYEAWKSNFGAVLPRALQAPIQAVPEPSSAIFFLIIGGMSTIRWCPSVQLPTRRMLSAFCACLIALIGFSTLLSGNVVAKPNILFIMADDLGWADVSTGLTNGGDPSDFYETPTLERLASEGMAFTNAYANQNCAPTRSAILSGAYAQRPTNNIYQVGDLNRWGNNNTLLLGPSQGLPGSEADAIPNSTVTYAETLQSAGYRTAYVGKFHVTDGNSNTQQSDIENFHGFDQNFGGKSDGGPGAYHASGGTFGTRISMSLDAYAAGYTQQYVDENIKPFNNGAALSDIDDLVGTAKHVTDASTDAAIDFMEANKLGSFFIQYSSHAVHTPIGDSQARDDLLKKYQNKPVGSEDTNQSFGALIEGLDQSVDRLITYLETTPDPNSPGQNLDDNTIVIFYSDNGGRQNQSNNGTLKGQKGEFDEGGIRVPMIAWSGNPALVDGGTINDTPIAPIDFYKTFANLGDATLPASQVLDGEDLTQVLSDVNYDLGREALYWHLPGYLQEGRNQKPQSVIRSGDSKLMYNYEDQSFELYDLQTDLSESNNLANDNPQPDAVGELGVQLMRWLANTQAPLATVRTGVLNLDFTGAYYADGKIAINDGVMQVQAGEEAPFILGDALSLADLNMDNTVSAADWIMFRAGQGANFDGVSLFEAFEMGDLDGDFDNDVNDFILFKAAFELELGPGSFELVTSVPEPQSLLIVTCGGLALLRALPSRCLKQHTDLLRQQMDGRDRERKE